MNIRSKGQELKKILDEIAIIASSIRSIKELQSPDNISKGLLVVQRKTLIDLEKRRFLALAKLEKMLLDKE